MRQATEKQTEQTKIRAEKKNKEGQTEGPRSSQRPHQGRAEAQDRMIAMASKSSLWGK